MDFRISGGAERWLKIPLDISQPPITYAEQALAVVRKTPSVAFFGPTTGFIVNYTPDHAVRFDVEGRPIESLARAYRPGAVTLYQEIAKSFLQVFCLEQADEKDESSAFHKYGPPSVLALEELPVPDLKPGEVLVELHAAAVNPSDVKNVAGIFKASLPRVPGRDYAGVVIAGDDWRGKEVWGSGAGFGVARDGSHAQYVIVDFDGLSEKPLQLSMAEASTVGVPYLAAFLALIHAADIRSGETILITGALGAVGRAATQIAHWKKAKVIGVDRSNNPSEADALINTKAGYLPARSRR